LLVYDGRIRAVRRDRLLHHRQTTLSQTGRHRGDAENRGTLVHIPFFEPQAGFSQIAEGQLNLARQRFVPDDFNQAIGDTLQTRDSGNLVGSGGRHVVKQLLPSTEATGR
jgi:hypothetical protein